MVHELLRLTRSCSDETAYEGAIAGTGYVGLSNAMRLAQHHEIVALDIVPEKVDELNRQQSPIDDPEIEDFLANRTLNFRATLDKEAARQWYEACGFEPSPTDPYHLFLMLNASRAY